MIAIWRGFTLRERAMVVTALAVGLDLLWAFLFAHVSHLGFGTSLYWAVGKSTTDGSSINEVTGSQQLLSVLVEITDVPLFGGVYALVTGLVSSERIREHVEAAEERIKTHLTERFHHHLGHND